MMTGAAIRELLPVKQNDEEEQVIPKIALPIFAALASYAAYKSYRHSDRRNSTEDQSTSQEQVATSYVERIEDERANQQEQDGFELV